MDHRSRALIDIASVAGVIMAVAVAAMAVAFAPAVAWMLGP